MLNKFSLLLITVFTINSLLAQSNIEFLKQISTDERKLIEKMNLPGEIYKITDKISGKSIYKNLGEYRQKKVYIKLMPILILL